MAVAEALAVARKVVSGQLPAPKLRKRAQATRPSEAVAPEKFLGKPDGPDPSVKTTGTSFRAARRARPKPKPSMILRVALTAPKITERARATARVCHGCRGSFGRRPESCFGKPNGPAPKRQNYGSEREEQRAFPKLSRKLRPSPRKFSREARRARQHDGNAFRQPDGPDPSPNLRCSSRRENGTRRAQAGFLRTLNPKRF